jgi:hypothetical protein
VGLITKLEEKTAVQITSNTLKANPDFIIQILKRNKIKVKKGFAKRLSKALDKRNYVIHHLLVDGYLSGLSVDDHLQIIEDAYNDIRLAFNDLDQVFKTIIIASKNLKEHAGETVKLKDFDGQPPQYVMDGLVYLINQAFELNASRKS